MNKNRPASIYRPPLPPFICCFDTLGAVAAAGRAGFAFFTSLSFFSVFAFVMAARRCCVRTAAVWLRRAAMVARSAPTMPRWCFTVLRERFLATSYVMPFLCMRRYTTVHAILRGFLRCRKSDAFFELAKRNTCGQPGGQWERREGGG